MNNNNDPYYLKTIDYAYKGHKFVFDVAHTIFSTFDVDIGSKLLIRSLKLKYSPESILDVGCGNGVLGIVFSKLLNIKKVTLSDINMLSLRYAQRNLEKNNVDAQIVPSVGLENIEKFEYDLIVSNIPAKVGDKAIEEDFILAPLEYLKKGHEYWFVVISSLNRIIPKLGEKNNLNMRLVTKRNRYAVYKIVK